jgi:CheY-like chemotaxis protein
MAKIMLVEDDNNLREIYGERLIAEGYEIVSAKDGEEALALAVKEKPDLIISDVMMPKISGFDMLDILRQTPETKNTKVIMMTALSQAEDKQRASSLGADKYLVKSQVTLEDVARVVDDVLNDRSAPIQVPDASVPTATEILSSQTTATAVAQEPTAVNEQPVVAEPSVVSDNPVVAEPAPVVAMAPAPAPEASDQAAATATEVAGSAETEPQVAVVEPTPVAQPPVATESAPINPMVAVTQQPTEEKKAELVTPDSSVKPESAAEELAQINKQIENFVASEPTEQAEHQVAMVEPSPEQIEKAAINAEKSNNPDPTVIAAAPVRPANDDEPASARKKVINPITDASSAPSINELYQKELAKEAENEPVINPGAGTNIEIESQEAEQPAVANPMVVAGNQESVSAEAQAVEQATANAAPLETADLSQIEGITTNETSEQPSETVAPSPEPLSENPAPTTPASGDPIDPNNIAL